MPVKLRVTSAACALYDTASGDLPFSDPVTYLSLVKFHSSLDYVESFATYTGTLTLPARTWGSKGVVTYPIITHGRGAAPLAMGFVSYAGADWPLAGLVPIQPAGGLRARRSIFLSCDATFVSIGESFIARGPASSTVEFGEISFSWTVLVTNRTMPYVAPSYGAQRSYFTGPFITFGGGRFDSRRKYCRSDSSTGAIMPSKGRTQCLATGIFYNAPTWGYACGSVAWNADVNAAAGFSPAAPTRIVG